MATINLRQNKFRFVRITLVSYGGRAGLYGNSATKIQSITA